MSAAGRLLLSLLLAMGSTGTALRASLADPREAPSATLPVRPADGDWFGTWSGTITIDGVPEPLDGGYIAIERAPGDRLAVTVGPETLVRYSGMRLERTERGLRFEVSLPGFETRLLAYDVEIGHRAMTGTVTFVRHGLTQPARLEFIRNEPPRAPSSAPGKPL